MKGGGVLPRVSYYESDDGERTRLPEDELKGNVSLLRPKNKKKRV